MSVTEPFDPDLTEWDCWSPAEVARRLAAFQAPWFVAAGWAIDLFLGGQRREHGDLEIAIPRARFPEIVRALPEVEFFVPVGENGNALAWPLARAGEFMETRHQTWGREPGADRWRVDVFREPWEGDTWVFRRDERIQRPISEVIERTADGIPYLSPEVNLLFKAKHSHLEKNQHDFAAVLPLLDGARRAWLAEALAIVHPEHAWLAALR